jgi:hypothetical protein
MPLLRRMARTAVVAGTATAVSNNVSRRQAARWESKEQEQMGSAQPQQAPQPTYAEPSPVPAADTGGLTEQLQQLADLKAQGVLTDEEFAAAKAKLLQG